MNGCYSEDPPAVKYGSTLVCVSSGNRHGDSAVFGPNTLPTVSATYFLPSSAGFTKTTGKHKSSLKTLSLRVTAEMNNPR